MRHTMKTNGKEKELAKGMEYYESLMFFDNLSYLKNLKVACSNAKQAELLKQCFDNVDFLEVRFDDIVYLVQATASTRQKNRLQYIKEYGDDPEDR